MTTKVCQGGRPNAKKYGLMRPPAASCILKESTNEKPGGFVYFIERLELSSK